MQVEEYSSTTSRKNSRVEVSNQRKHCSGTSFEDMTTTRILLRSVKAKSHHCKVVKESFVKVSSLEVIIVKESIGLKSKSHYWEV